MSAWVASRLKECLIIEDSLEYSQQSTRLGKSAEKSSKVVDTLEGLLDHGRPGDLHQVEVGEGLHLRPTHLSIQVFVCRPYQRSRQSPLKILHHSHIACDPFHLGRVTRKGVRLARMFSRV